MTDIDRQYREQLAYILREGAEDMNERTGHKTKAVPGVHFRFTEGFPLLTLRKIPVTVFVAEQIWFLMGSRKPGEFLDRYTKIWRDFTNINGIVSTAYGYRWRYHFGRDQIAGLVRLLETEPSSRHGVVITWDPADDGLMPGRKKKNVPCPFAFTANIIGGKLHLHNIVRSNDMILGFPHDVAGFALLQRILAARLGVGVGVYSHSISNAHIYDIHYEAAQELVARRGQESEIQLTGAPDWFARAEAGDASLVDEIVDTLTGQYRPEAAIKGLAIVV
jgi:thymidylate synthase